MPLRGRIASENYVADHLSRLTTDEVTPQGPGIQEEFFDEKLFNISIRPWFTEMANFKAIGALPDDLTCHQKKFLGMLNILCGMILIYLKLE